MWNDVDSMGNLYRILGSIQLKINSEALKWCFKKKKNFEWINQFLKVVK